MLSFWLSLFLPILFHSFEVKAVLQNSSCPLILSKPVIWNQLSGKWFIQAVTTDLEVAGDCATFTFTHEEDKTLVSIKWIQDKVTSYYNGTSVDDIAENRDHVKDHFTVKYSDGESGTYRFLELQKNEYALMYSCTNLIAGNLSDFELWELTRSPVKGEQYFKLLKGFLKKYRIPKTHFLMFDNSPETCPSGASIVNPSTLIVVTLIWFVLCLKLL